MSPRTSRARRVIALALGAASLAAARPARSLAQGSVLLQGIADGEFWSTDARSNLLTRNNGQPAGLGRVLHQGGSVRAADSRPADDEVRSLFENRLASLGHGVHELALVLRALRILDIVDDRRRADAPALHLLDEPDGEPGLSLPAGAAYYVSAAFALG